MVQDQPLELFWISLAGIRNSVNFSKLNLSWAEGLIPVGNLTVDFTGAVEAQNPHSSAASQGMIIYSCYEYIQHAR